MEFGETHCLCCSKRFRYPRHYGVVKYCSAACRIVIEPPAHPWEYKGCTSSKYYNSRRRRKMRRGDSIDPLVVYLAFDWTCWLCHGKIDPTVRMPDGQCATIDHIIPLSRNGRHVWENVAPAHKDCNDRKETNDTTEGSDRIRLPNSLSRQSSHEPVVQSAKGFSS